ncbi:hypothetical protein NIES4106_61230 (plasmid) [Fischerella sp. NIES-4106]|nr:hypothetical protein NIES4106_61230 [Fischerella sp. NIES-4106]
MVRSECGWARWGDRTNLQNALQRVESHVRTHPNTPTPPTNNIPLTRHCGEAIGWKDIWGVERSYNFCTSGQFIQGQLMRDRGQLI